MTKRKPVLADPPLKAGEVAALFAVDPRTVGRWAREGKLPFIRTLGGHRRFLKSEVLVILDAGTRQRTESGHQ